MPAPAKRDLGELAHHPDYDVKVQIQRRETEPDAQHRRYKELVTLWAAIGFLGVLVVAALAVLLLPWMDPESKKWATSALSVIAAGAVGFLLGGKKSAD